MEIYEQKSRWKIYLAIAALVVVAASMFYTNYIASRLAEGERDRTELFGQEMGPYLEKMYAPIKEGEKQEDLTDDLNKITKLSKGIPIILVDESGIINAAYNFAENADWQEELEKIKSTGQEPIEGKGYDRYIYYKNTFLLTLLTYFPLFQLLLLLIFIGVGYLGFSSARRSEQNRVWVGMAKETAHQLGTPISAIIAWLEHLKIMKPDDEETLEIVAELENDVSRLELVADRFSKIGSAPKLEPINIYAELEKCRAYMQRRAPRKVAFEFPDKEQTALMVNINPHLFDWVIENLLRNALDAMGGTGQISAHVYEDSSAVNIDITDTGKGIPASKFKTVFEPGFTTKKRGWGLGLSLTKRIIENYHSGKIFVKKSVLNEGTTFTIKLPKLK